MDIVEFDDINPRHDCFDENIQMEIQIWKWNIKKT